MDLLPVVSSVLPHAAAVALSPMPIAALILLLLSNRAKLNSLSFLIGWVIAIYVNVGLFMIIFDSPVNSSASQSQVMFYIHMMLGIFLLVIAGKEWMMRPMAGVTPKTPKWMKAIDGMSPLMAFVIAFGLVTINAKNTVIDIAAGVQIGQNTSNLIDALIVLSIYAFVASISILVPVIGFFILGNKLNSKLEDLKSWFLYHNASILFVLFLILGLSMISKAFGN